MKNLIFPILAVVLVLSSCKKEDPVVNEPTPTPEPTNPILETDFAALAGLFNGEGVGAAINLSDDVLLLFNQDGDEFVWFEEQEVKASMSMDASDNFMSGCPFDELGAAVFLGSNRFYVFDEDGATYSAGTIDIDNVSGGWDREDLVSWGSNTHDMSEWGDDSCPFNTVGASWKFSEPNEGCFDATEAFGSDVWMIDGSGDEIVRYFHDTSFGQDKDLEDFAVENNCGGMDGLFPIDDIGAACRYVLPNRIQEVFFTRDGKQMVFYTVSEGIFSEVYDLY